MTKTRMGTVKTNDFEAFLLDRYGVHLHVGVAAGGRRGDSP